MLSAAEERHKEMSLAWLKEREDLKKEISTIKKSKEKAEDELSKAQRNLDSAVSLLQVHREPNLVNFEPTKFFWSSLPRKIVFITNILFMNTHCLLYTSPSPRDKRQSRMPSSA